MQIFVEDNDVKIIDEKYVFNISDKKNFNHIINVMRKRVKDKIVVVYKKTKYEGCITKIDLKNCFFEVTAYILESQKEQESKFKIHIYQGIPKGNKIDLIVEKISEIGALSFTPVELERSIVKKKDIKENKIKRWKNKAISAAEQSKRTDVMTINEAKTLEEMLDEIIQKEMHLIIAYEDEKENNLKDVLLMIKSFENDMLNNIKLSQTNIAVLIGPEGGITEEEINKIKNIKNKTKNIVESVSLGKTILRTETAPIFVLAILQYELGDLNNTKEG